MQCIECEHYTLKPLKDEPEYREYSTMGLGRCKMDHAWQDEGNPTIFVIWNSNVCTKAEPAKDMAARIKWVSKQGGVK